MFVGTNGHGKTTTLAKVGHLLKNKGLKCIFAAGDTFRAAAQEQLQEHGDKLGIKVIKHTYGSDAAAVAFDAVKHAEARQLDAVLIDTAGRQHSDKNLMDELKKIKKVVNPNLTIYVCESIAGNDAWEQGKNYNTSIGIDGMILTKSDVDERENARYGSDIQNEEIENKYNYMNNICKKAISQCEEIVFSDKNYKVPEDLYK